MAAPGQQLVQFPFSGGIDEGTRAEVVDPASSFLKLENIRQDATGAANKRLGFTALSSVRFDGTTRSAGYRLFADEDTACVIDGHLIDVYDPAKAKWVPRGRVPEASFTTRALPSMAVSNSVEDVEVCNGYIAVAYRTVSTASYASTTAATFAAVVNEATGALVSAPAAIGSTSSLGIYTGMASFSSRYFVCVNCDNSSSTITAYILDTSTATTIAAGWSLLATVTAAADWNTAGGVSCCSLEDRIAIVYVNTSGGTSRLSVKTYNQTGALETAVVNTASLTPNAVDVAGSNADTLWVAWDEGAGGAFAHMKGLTGNSLATVKATTGSIIATHSGTWYLGISPTTAGAGRLLAFDNTTGISDWPLLARDFVTSGGVATGTGSTAVVYNASPQSKPFYQGGRHYVVVAPSFTGSAGGATGNQQKLAVLVDCTDYALFWRPVANMAPSLAATAFGVLTKVPAGTTATSRYYGLTVTKSGVANAATLFTLDFASTSRWADVRHGDSTFLSGGVLSYFDGQRVTEAGFLSRPTKPTTTTSGTGITLSTGRKYVAVYEDIDADGNWVVSGVSDASANTVTVGSKTITVKTTPITVTARLLAPGSSSYTGTRVAFYATADNGGIAPYYRLGVVLNDPTGASVSYQDTTSDATLLTAAKLYAPNLPGGAGEPLDRRAPPGLAHLVSYNGMLVGSEGSNLWWSGQPVSGEATWFNPVFQVPISDTDDVTALWVQDGALIAATRSRIYAFSGEVPSDSGSTGGLGPPRRLSVDVGCTDARSVVGTSLGTFFRSGRGLELLSRALSVEWVGLAVQATVNAYPYCVAATVDAASSTVLFDLALTDTADQVAGGGRTVVFDLALKTWVSTDRRKNAAGTSDTAAQDACIIWTGSSYRYAWLGVDGIVYVEDATTHLDAGAWVAMAADTGNVKVSGFQGQQHVNKTMLLGKYATPHDLKLYIATDYGSYGTPRTFTAAQLAQIAVDIPNQQLAHGMDNNARGEAVRVRWEDATPSSGTVGTGAGATWIAPAFEVLPKEGAFQLPDEAR